MNNNFSRNFHKSTAVLLALVLLLLAFSTAAFAEEKPINVYATVSNGGVFEQDKDGAEAVRLDVALEGQSEYTIGDVLQALHEQYSANGAEDYATAEGSYGDYIVKVWGVETSDCGYYLNGAMAYGLTDAVANGDSLEIMIYANAYPDTEAYASFNQATADVTVGTDVELVLYYGSYDENYNLVMNPCEGAVITVNGEATEIVTDAEGNATVSISEEGTYIISAALTKTVADQETTAITAPVCVVTATANS